MRDDQTRARMGKQYRPHSQQAKRDGQPFLVKGRQRVRVVREQEGQREHQREKKQRRVGGKRAARGKRPDV